MSIFGVEIDRVVTCLLASTPTISLIFSPLNYRVCVYTFSKIYSNLSSSITIVSEQGMIHLASTLLLFVDTIWSLNQFLARTSCSDLSRRERAACVVG
ncbi:hypothetical protein NL676_024693 [Syzygium grande]|nr:hypothetical protein NL676_024693 [Syzygium grande]